MDFQGSKVIYNLQVVATEGILTNSVSATVHYRSDKKEATVDALVSLARDIEEIKTLHGEGFWGGDRETHSLSNLLARMMVIYINSTSVRNTYDQSNKSGLN